MAQLKVILYSRLQNKRIIYSDTDGVMISEIEKTLMSRCEILDLRHTGARIEVCDKTRNALLALQNKYDKASKSHIRKLMGFLKGLTDGDFFYYFNEEKTSVVERRTAIYCLKAIKNGNPYSATLHNRIFSYYSQMSIMFEMLSFGYDGLEEWIGEPVENKRICRFCGKSVPSVSFKKIAHAIQDALGNKLLFCYEECDTCNHDLAMVEDQFRILMDFRRSIFRIPRKDTTKAAKVVGKDFIIVPDTKGDPIMYLMKEYIADSIDTTKPFVHHFELKSPVVNEQMYKALCKMVIDMLPTCELPHFKNTIEWIKSKNFMPDTLPSIWLINLPCDKPIFRQPILDVFLNNQHNIQNTPYCTSVVWFYDIAYIFIVPLVDIDAGQYKYDINLKKHWDFMKKWLGLCQWQQQDTRNYNQSTVWVNWEVDPTSSCIKILPKDNEIFKECQKKKICISEVPMSDFDSTLLSVVHTPNVSFTQLYTGSICDKDLKDVTQHIAGPSFVINTNKEIIKVCLSIEVCDTTDRIKYFECQFSIDIHVERFNEYVMITNDDDTISFAFHYQLRDCLLDYALRQSEIEMSKQRKNTSFEKCSLDKLCVSQDRLAAKIIYLLPVDDMHYMKIEDSQIHINEYE